MFRLYRVIFRPSKTTDPIITRWGPEDDSIESKHVAHISIVVDIRINSCVRLLHLVPILLMPRLRMNAAMRFLPLCAFMVWTVLLNLFALFTFQTFWVGKKNAAEDSAGEPLISLFSIQAYWYPTLELKVALMLIRQVDTAPGQHKNRLYI